MARPKTTAEFLDGIEKVPQSRALVKRDPAEERRLVKAAKAEIATLAKYLVEDPLYLLDLKRRLASGKLHPTIESMLFAYAYGKPKERIEVHRASIVRIVHEFADDPKPIQGEVIDVKPGGSQGDSAKVESAPVQGDAFDDEVSGY